MKTTLMMTVALTGMMAGSALATPATVSDVLVRQRWPWSRKADISFVLGQSDAYQDVTLTAYNGTTRLGVIPDAALTGDMTVGLSKEGGRFSYVFDPAKSGFGADVMTRFRVEVSAADSTYVLYKIVNLVASNVTDVTIGDLKSGKYGAWQENPVEGVRSVIWTGVTNVDVWATTNLVLRHIKAGSYYMGYYATNGAAAPSESQRVTISKDFYIGVFEMTQRQWELIYPALSVTNCYYTNRLYYATRPVEYISSYTRIRGGSWPTSSAVGAGTFCANLSAMTGGLAFDLPTEGQWEYACRAGTQTELNIGVNYTAAALAEVSLGDRVVGTQSSDLTCGTMRVGYRRPNAWGLYDMHGNACEWSRDWFTSTPPASINSPVTTDPTGPRTGTVDPQHTWIVYRLLCGTPSPWYKATYAIRTNYGPDWSDKFVGFRIMMQP